MTEADAAYRYDAFISYSHHDKEWVQGWLLPQLEAAGLRVCIDFRDFEPGLPSLVNMENAVERSRKTLIVLTRDWVKSEWTTFESLLIQTGDPAGRRRRMIPLMLKPCKLPKRITMLTYLDFTQPSEVKFQLGRLVAAIKGEPMPTGSAPALETVREERSNEVQQMRAAKAEEGSQFRPLAGEGDSEATVITERTHLVQLLNIHSRNLDKLRKQAAIYGAGEAPLRLLNQIESEEQEIQRLQAQLALQGVAHG